MASNQVTIKGKDGRFYQIDQSGLNDALNEGYVIPPNEEIQHEINVRKEGESTLGAIAAGAEAGASAATFGLSRELENISGLTTPEAQALRQEAHPTASAIGTTAGVVLPIALTMGASAPATVLGGAAKTAARFTPIGALTKASAAATEAVTPALKAAMSGLAQTSPKLAGALSSGAAMGGVGALEGAVYGVGQSIDEHALGDPEAFGEHLITNVGINSALGGGIGSIFGGVSGALNAPKKIKAQIVDEDIAQGAISGDKAIFDAPKTGVQPTSMEDLAKKVNQARADGVSVELPQKAVLEDAISRLELENTVHPVQLGSLDDQATRDAYNIMKETADDNGNTLRNYEAIQKNELVQKTAKTVEEIAPSHIPTSDAIKAGEQANEMFTAAYQAEKEQAGALVAEAKKLKGEGFDHLTGVVDLFTGENPKIAQMLEIKDGVIKVKPGVPAGMPDETFKAVKRAIKQLQENPQDFSVLFDIRKDLGKSINLLSNKEGANEIMALKRVMMDYMQGMVDSSIPELRDGFKRYAINEQNRGVIEKAFGGSVGAAEFGGISKIKPEIITDKMFSNTATVDAAKRILGPENFNKNLSNWLSENIAKVTDKGAFSSNKFATFLRKNQDVLAVAFADNPAALQRLNDLANVMRILPDAASINPSGTAKTLIGMVKKIDSASSAFGTAVNLMKDYTYGIIENKIAVQNLNNALAGRAEKATMMTKIKSMADKSQRAIESSAKAVFSDTGASMAIGIGSDLIHTDDPKEIEKAMEKVKELSTDPERTMNALEQNTEALHQFAPETAMSVQKSMVAATQYLASKIPQPGNQKILSEEYSPSRSDLMKFNNAYQTIKTPTSVLAGIKHGMVTSEQLNALKSVYPKMLEQMQMAVVEQLSEHMAKERDIPYKTKLGLSQFLDRPLTNSMTQESIAMNQMSGGLDGQAEAMGPTQKGLGSLNASGRIKTSMTSIQNGEEA